MSYAQTARTKVAPTLAPSHEAAISLPGAYDEATFPCEFILHLLSDGFTVYFVGLHPQEDVIYMTLGPLSLSFTVVSPPPRTLPELLGTAVKGMSVPSIPSHLPISNYLSCCACGKAARITT